jgi:hypothetical protein
MATICGQTTVVTAGSAVRLHANLAANAALMVKALPTNTGLMYVGQVEGDVDSANGLPLAASEAVIFSFVGNLNQIWVDASVNGEKVAWLILEL